jgi:hypothetical protein
LEEFDTQDILDRNAAVLRADGLRVADHLVNHIKEVADTSGQRFDMYNSVKKGLQMADDLVISLRLSILWKGA